MTTPDSRTAAEHTPGPLRASDLPSREGVYHIRAGGGNGRRIGLAYSAADARLWADASDLLAALEEIADWIAAARVRGMAVTNLAIWENTARAAIAKARGIGQNVERLA